MTNKKFRVGLIGTGFGQSTQLPGFQARADMEVVAVCSAHLDKAQRVAQEHHIPAAYDDYRTMLERERLDIVSITPPPYTHKEMTLAAFAAGAHVLCEKPMAMNAGEAQAMCDAARAARRVGMIDHEFRYVPARRYVEHLIRDGYIGRPYHVNIANFGGGRGDPLRHFGWWFDASTGGGMLGAIGSHYIDGLATFVADIVEVCGLTDAQIRERPDPQTGQARRVSSDDNCAFIARLADGATASVQLSSVARPGTGERIQVFGSDGTLLIDHNGHVWGGKASEPHVQQMTVPDEFKVDGAGLVGPFKVLLGRLVQGIERMQAGEVRDPASDITPSFADGLKVQRVMDAIRQSSDGAGWVRIG